MATQEACQIWLQEASQRSGAPSVSAWLTERGWSAAEARAQYQCQVRPWRPDATDRPGSSLQPLTMAPSRDGQTTKALFELDDGATIEAVLMRHHGRRNTVCLSSQAGCAHACAFCATGQAGFTRQLRALEILDQALHFARLLAPQGERVTNVVFMGMGEPLANLGSVLAALRLLTDDAGLAVGRRRVTISTVGLVPEIRELARQGLGVRLAVSLHAPDDALRSQLMPVNLRYPLSELLAACRAYAEATGQRVLVEYLMLEGLNDQDEHARQLAARLGPCFHVNLIPFNPTPAVSWRASSDSRLQAFAARLREAGLSVTRRAAMGQDVTAACGQLATPRAARGAR